jgi:ThiF family/IclR helix-turn-helix domain
MPAPPANRIAARPVLKRGLRTLWRDASTVQIGIDPDVAVVLSGMNPASARLLDALDGTRDAAGLEAAARRLGLHPAAATNLLSALETAGLLDDDAAASPAADAISLETRERLEPDAAALALTSGSSDGGLGALGRRADSAVRIVGADRVGMAVSTMLAAAGVGHVDVRDSSPVLPCDPAPAGAGSDDVGRRRDVVATDSARRVSPSVRMGPTRTPDVVVLCGPSTADHRRRDRLLSSGIPHLAISVRETTGVVGPLVLPGKSSCLRCHDLHRRDRDPAWPWLAAQLTSPAGAVSDGCETVLALALAAHASLHVLAHLDGAPMPPSVDGTVELALPHGGVRRRSWAPHPACGCRWPEHAAAAADASA